LNLITAKRTVEEETETEGAAAGAVVATEIGDGAVMLIADGAAILNDGLAATVGLCRLFMLTGVETKLDVTTREPYGS